MNEFDIKNMILPKGITGFAKPSKDEKSLLTKEILSQLIKNIKHNSFIEFIRFQEIEASTNYYKLTLSQYNKEIKILINGIFPLYCGVKNYNWQELEFIHLSDKIISLFPEPFNYLKPCILEKNIFQKEEYLANLDKYELKQIKYWKSKTFGEVIFNGYD